jgi:uncharacterized protein HemX
MTPTNQRHPHNRYPDDVYPRTAEEDDARLQPDPELALSTGQASRAQIWLVAIGAAAIAGVVLYGISQTPKEPETAASPPAQTTGAAPSAEPPAQEQQQQPKAASETPAQEPAKPAPSDSTR